MNWAYDEKLNKWVVLLSDIVIRLFDTEEEAKSFIKLEEKRKFNSRILH